MSDIIDTAAVESIVRMGSRLGLQIVAEGAERSSRWWVLPASIWLRGYLHLHLHLHLHLLVTGRPCHGPTL